MVSNLKTYIALPPKVNVTSAQINGRKLKFLRIGSYVVINGVGSDVSVQTNFNNKAVIIPEIGTGIKENNYAANLNQSLAASSTKQSYVINFPPQSAAIKLAQSSDLNMIPLQGKVLVTACVPGNNYQEYIQRGLATTAYILNTYHSVQAKFNGMNTNCHKNAVIVSIHQ